MYYEGKLFRDENGKVYFNDVDGEGFTEIVVGGSSEPTTAAYKVYVSLMSHISVESPITATVLENTLGGEIVWEQDSAGVYLGTLTGAFIQHKTICLCNNIVDGLTPAGDSPANFVQIVRINNDTIKLSVGLYIDGEWGQNNLLNDQAIEIRVYP